jgi:hypothetical protein
MSVTDQFNALAIADVVDLDVPVSVTAPIKPGHVGLASGPEGS